MKALRFLAVLPLAAALLAALAFPAHAQSGYTPGPNGRWITGTQTITDPKTGQIQGTWQLGFTPCDKNGSPLPTTNDNLSYPWDSSTSAQFGYVAAYVNSDNSLNLTGPLIPGNLSNSYPQQGLLDGNAPSQATWQSLIGGGYIETPWFAGNNLGRMPNGDVLLLSLYVQACNYYYPNGDTSKPLMPTNGAVSAQLSAQLSGYYRWDPQFTPASGYTGGISAIPITPSSFPLRIIPSWYNMNGSGYTFYNDPNTSCSLSVSDSFGDLITGVIYTPSYIYQMSPHLVQAAVDPVTGIASVGMTATVTASVTNNYPLSQGRAESHLLGKLQAYVLPDPRGVTISSGVNTTYYKLLTGGVDANGDGVWARVAHTPATDGTMKGDLGVPYGSQHLNNQSIEVVSATSQDVTYTGHIPGNWATWDSQYWWNSSLKNYNTSEVLYHLNGSGLPTESEIPVLKNTYVGPIVDSDTGKIIPNEAGTNGTTDHLFFKFKNGDNTGRGPLTGNDGDGATATSNYYLTIHQPVENFPSNRPDEYNHYKVASPAGWDLPMSFQGLDYSTYKGYKGAGQNGISALCVINSPSVGWGISNDVTNTLSSVPYPGWWGALDVIFQGANIWVSHNTPVSQSFSADFNDIAWSDPQSDGDKFYHDKTYSNSKAYFHMSPRVRVQYSWHYKLVDVYNATGFQSETLNHSEKYIGPQNAFGYFTYFGPPVKIINPQ